MAQTNDQNMTVIGPDAHIKGEMSFSGSAKILGTFEGSIRSEGQIAVGQGATCNAQVHANRVVVDGAINGDVHGDERIELNSGARVQGDISAGNLVVVEGASFVGHCRVGPGAERAETKAREQKPAAAEPAKSADKTAPQRPRVETRSLRPATGAGESAAAPTGAAAAVARATTGAANNTAWLRNDEATKDDQNAA